MAFTVGEVIAGARAWHPSFDETIHGDTVALDWLNSFLRVERRKLQTLVPEMFLSQVLVPLPFAVLSEGADMPAETESVFSADALMETAPIVRGESVAIVPLEHIHDIGIWPALSYVAAPINKIFLKGAEDDWANYVGLLLKIVLNPVRLNEMSDTILLPDAYQDVCVAGLSVFFGMRGGKERIGPAQWLYFIEREKEVRAAADAALASQRAGEIWRIRELV